MYSYVLLISMGWRRMIGKDCSVRNISIRRRVEFFVWEMECSFLFFRAVSPFRNVLYGPQLGVEGFAVWDVSFVFGLGRCTGLCPLF